MPTELDLPPESQKVLLFLSGTERWYTTDHEHGQDLTTEQILAQLRPLRMAGLVSLGVDFIFSAEITPLNTYYKLSDAGHAAVSSQSQPQVRSVA